MNIRRILGASVIGAGVVAGSALPAAAMPLPAPTTQVQFVVVDGNGVLYTGEHLTPGQVIHHGITWFTVRSVRPYGSGISFTVTPKAPAGVRVTYWT